MGEIVTIGELAKRTNTKINTIIFYTNEKLLKYDMKLPHARKKFDYELNVKILDKIKELKDKRYTVNEIKEVINQEFPEENNAESEIPVKKLDLSKWVMSELKNIPTNCTFDKEYLYSDIPGGS